MGKVESPAWTRFPFGNSRRWLQGIDPYAVGSRGVLNHLSGVIPRDLSSVLNCNRMAHEERRAREYADIYDSLLRGVRGLGFQKGEQLLEIGVGPGVLAEEMANEKGLQIVGIDIQDLRANKSGYAFGLAFGQNLPFPNGFFNYVSLTSVLHHISRDQHLRVVEEGRRVLSKDGYFLVQEDIRGRNSGKQMFIRTVDWLVSGPESNSHKTVGEWENFFTKSGLEVSGSQVISPEGVEYCSSHRHPERSEGSSDSAEYGTSCLDSSLRSE